MRKAKVTVDRGKTAHPKGSKEQARLGIRMDFDGEVEQDGIVYNKFQVQPNAGKIPSSLRRWRDENGGTHAVMGSMLVKKNGTTDDVNQAWDAFVGGFMGGQPSAGDEAPADENATGS